MRFLIIIPFLFGCGIQKSLEGATDQIKSIGSSIDSVSDGMKSMKEALGKQGLAMALKELLSEDSTFFVSPGSTNPLSMIPPGKALAEIASPEDLAGLFYLWITEINTAQVDSLDKEELKKSDRKKWIKLTALQVIAAFITQDKIEEIIKTQENGRYHESVSYILLLRHVFISSYLLDMGVLAKAKINKAEYAVGLAAVEALKFIENRPDSKSYELKIIGFNDNEGLGLNQAIKIDESADRQLEKLNGIPKT